MRKQRPLRWSLLAGSVMLCVNTAWGQQEAVPTELVRTIAAAGGDYATDGVLELIGTLGEQLTGPTADDGLTAFQGFWTPGDHGAVANASLPGPPNAGMRLTASPNPLVEATEIEIHTDVAGLFTLALYDMLGGHAATLVDGSLAAGETTVRLDASGLSPGRYTALLTGPDDISALSLIVVR